MNKKIITVKNIKKLYFMEDILKKSYIFIIIVLITLIISFGIYFLFSNNNYGKPNSNNFSYNSTRLSINNELIENPSTENNQNNASYQSNEQEKKQETETLISEYTTKIYSKDSNRQQNISITCSKINNTIINNNETFSFYNIVGKATAEKGYKEADIFQNGKTIKGIGGGNCQVSSTIYNAVLGAEGLEVTERHDHGKPVPYVPEGKDAAVSFGSLDLKFVNHTGNKIKISAYCDENNVYIKIYKIE